MVMVCDPAVFLVQYSEGWDGVVTTMSTHRTRAGAEMEMARLIAIPREHGFQHPPYPAARLLIEERELHD